MLNAVRNGHESIVILCKEWGATDFDGAMARAVANGHESIVKLCKEWGATKFWWVITYTAMHGRGDRHELYKVTNYDLEMFRAAARDENILELCNDWGVNDYDLGRAGRFFDTLDIDEFCKMLEDDYKIF